MEATLIGIDVAKSVLHLVAMSSQSQVIWRKALPRRRVLDFLAQLRPATVAMEECAPTHYWGREIQKLGHQVRLIHPAFVVPFRKSGKNDFNDAEAICEASCRPMTRFVELKAISQQDLQSIHRARRLLIKQRTQAANHLRGLCAGRIRHHSTAHFGAAARGCLVSGGARAVLLDHAAGGITTTSSSCGCSTSSSLNSTARSQMCRTDERYRRLAEVTGVGHRHGDQGRQCPPVPQRGALAAYLGLVPRQNSTAGKTVLLGITKRATAICARCSFMAPVLRCR